MCVLATSLQCRSDSVRRLPVHLSIFSYCGQRCSQWTSILDAAEYYIDPIQKTFGSISDILLSLREIPGAAQWPILRVIAIPSNLLTLYSHPGIDVRVRASVSA